ncbi:glycosyltransferase family A protein [Naasia lichenicola]|uniref:glycosyltransferase family A protein n=1 Tax=Naasia lichenicola TaxID=2565933 RepID=UPI00130D5090|nr:glycosyltransferase family 2 protein [Naasia lichenicola]
MPPSASPPSESLTVSVVIPVKDDAEVLRCCLAALGRQTRSPHEIIVVDNGSSDDVGEVADAYGATLIHEARPGIGAAAGAGYDCAQGGIIARLDADSVPADDWVHTIATAFANRPDVDAFTGSSTFTDGPAPLRRIGAGLYLGAYHVAAGAALSHRPLFGSNLAMRASAWQVVQSDVHRGDELIHDDFDLSFHLGPRHRIRYLPPMRVGISSRPFSDAKGLLRIRRGFRSVWIHWPHSLPHQRLGRRIGFALREVRSDLAARGDGDRLGRTLLRSTFAVDAGNVLILASAALAASRNAREWSESTVTTRWVDAAIGLIGLLAAARAVRIADDAGRATDRARLTSALRIVRAGGVFNLVASAAHLVLLRRGRGADRLGLHAGALHLLLGGSAVSAAYVRILTTWRNGVGS